MTDAYIYDALRTPRGKGRKDGALHELTAVRLSAQTMNAMKEEDKKHMRCPVAYEKDHSYGENEY